MGAGMINFDPRLREGCTTHTVPHLASVIRQGRLDTYPFDTCPHSNTCLARALMQEDEAEAAAAAAQRAAVVAAAHRKLFLQQDAARGLRSAVALAEVTHSSVFQGSLRVLHVICSASAVATEQGPAAAAWFAGYSMTQSPKLTEMRIYPEQGCECDIRQLAANPSKNSQDMACKLGNATHSNLQARMTDAEGPASVCVPTNRWMYKCDYVFVINILQADAVRRAQLAADQQAHAAAEAAEAAFVEARDAAIKVWHADDAWGPDRLLVHAMAGSGLSHPWAVCCSGTVYQSQLAAYLAPE